MNDNYMINAISAEITETIKHPNETELIDVKDCLNIEDACINLAFHARKLINDRSSTFCTSNRIESIKAVLKLVENYNDQLINLELKNGL